MNARIFKAPLFVAASLLLFFGHALAGERVVNCDEGGSLQNAINAGAGSAAPVEIYVTGVCTGDLIITRDRVSISGDDNTLIDGQVTVRGANNLTIRDLTITGPGNGINASVARIRMINVNLVENDDYGLALRHGGMISMRNGSVANNHGGIGLLIENGHGQLTDVEVTENDFGGIVVNVNGNLTMIGGSVNSHEQGTGISANLSSSVELVDVSVSNNLAGISVSKGSAAEINNSMVNENADVGIGLESGTLMVSGGAVSGNGGVGVLADNGSSFAADGVAIRENGLTGVGVRSNSNADIVNCTIGDNAHVNPNRSGVFVSTSSSATIDSTEVYGNGTGVGITRQSFVDLRGTTVVRDNLSDGVRLSYDSGAIVYDPVVIPPNGSGIAVSCRDTESSFENRSGAVGPVNCKDFNLPLPD